MIYEVIVTTLAPDQRVHIAPMGIKRDQDFVYISPFKPSTTLDNLLNNGHAVVNYVKDVRIFAGCLTGRYDWPCVATDKIKGQRLQAAFGHDELVVEEIEDDPQRPRARCRSVHRGVHQPFDGFNRAQAAVLEAAILVSRLHMLDASKIDAEVQYLRIAIDKTAGPDELIAWQWLMQRIDAHRDE